MKPAEHGRGHDGSKLGRFAFSAKRRVAIKALMYATTVVVSEELLEKLNNDPATSTD